MINTQALGFAEAVFEAEPLSEAEAAQLRANEKRDKTFHRPKQLHKRITAMIGKVGTGKSSLLGCLTGYADQGVPGWREGNSEIVIQHIPIPDSPNFQVEIYDANGFHGNLKEDWKILRKLVSDLSINIARVDCVMLCLSSARFTSADRNILKMLKDFTTPEFRARIRVVITHANQKLRNDQRFLNDVIDQLHILGNNREEILSKVIFVDLVHEDTFEEGSAARAEVHQRWAATQAELYEVIKASEGRTAVKSILSKSFYEEFLMVYKMEVMLAIAFVAIAILLKLFLSSYDMSLTRLEQVHSCMREVQKLQDAAKIPGPKEPIWKFFGKLFRK